MLRRRMAKRRQLKQNGQDDSKEGTDETEWVMEDEFDTGSKTSEHNELSSMKVWTQEDKAIYEEQLEHLHHQLTEALIENQDLKGQLKTTKLQTVHETASEAKAKKVNSAYGNYHGSTLSASTTREGFESVSVQPAVRRDSGGTKFIDRVKNWFFSLLYEFTEESYTEVTVSDAPPLQAKKLKDNLQRLASSSQPYRDFGEFLVGIVQWKNPSLSLVMFLLYMYCVWSGWLLQFILLMAIGYLIFNYLCVIGIVEQFGFQSKKRAFEENDTFKSLGLADKFQLVKEVGQMAQNASESIADNLEKGQNLLLWYYPKATRKIFTILCLSFILSLLLPNSWTLTFAGLGIGYKLFIIDNIYRKYPKVKEKHDGVARMWRSLPTNSQLEQRQRMTEEDLSSSNIITSPVTSITSLSVTDTLFTERFQLSLTELPLESWQSGRRCTLLDKERPLVNSKSGRLFLTHSYLCFERSPRPSDASDRFAIPLKDIVSLAKAKPFAVLPGSGMSLEIILKGNPKPVIFGAILHRDQAFVSLCDQAMILGMNWGSDPEGSGSNPSRDGNNMPLESTDQDETQ